MLNRLGRAVAGDGYLVLGAAETVVGLTDTFRTVPDLRGLYVPNVRPSRPAVIAGGRAAPRLFAVNGGR
jgi:chemotaxis protein methyltransferase CheR